MEDHLQRILIGEDGEWQFMRKEALEAIWRMHLSQTSMTCKIYLGVTTVMAEATNLWRTKPGRGEKHLQKLFVNHALDLYRMRRWLLKLTFSCSQHFKPWPSCLKLGLERVGSCPAWPVHMGLTYFLFLFLLEKPPHSSTLPFFEIKNMFLGRTEIQVK